MLWHQHQYQLNLSARLYQHLFSTRIHPPTTIMSWLGQAWEWCESWTHSWFTTLNPVGRTLRSWSDIVLFIALVGISFMSVDNMLWNSNCMCTWSNFLIKVWLYGLVPKSRSAFGAMESKARRKKNRKQCDNGNEVNRVREVVEIATDGARRWMEGRMRRQSTIASPNIVSIQNVNHQIREIKRRIAMLSH